MSQNILDSLRQPEPATEGNGAKPKRHPMITDQQIRDIAAKLVDKTRAKTVRWTSWEPYQLDYSEFGCLLALPNSAISLEYEAIEKAPSRVHFRIHPKDHLDTRIAEFSFEEGSADWELFSSLYKEACEVVYGWVTVMKDIQVAVDSPEPIGLEA